MYYTAMDSSILTQEDFLTLVKVLAKPSKRRVRFAPVVSSSTPNPLARDDLKQLWYNRQDLAAFSSEARKLASSDRSKYQVCESLRGLECRTLERRLHRHKTIQCTLSAHKKGMNADQTARVARTCTAWNEEIAFFQACHDYYNIYHPSITPSIPEVSNTPPKFPFELKRAANDTFGCRRRVRRRTQQ
jgi:hypothetical protein